MQGRIMSIANLETINPPMTARPSGADLRPSFTEADRHRYHAKNHGRSRNEDRSQAAARALLRRLKDGISPKPETLGEAHQQDGVGNGDSNCHDRSHERLNVQRGSR